MDTECLRFKGGCLTLDQGPEGPPQNAQPSGGPQAMYLTQSHPQVHRW